VVFYYNDINEFYNNIFYHCRENLTQRVMKKLMGLALALLCLTACSSDDNKTKTPSVSYDQLAKRWYYVATKVGDQVSLYDGNMPCGKDYLEFQQSNALKEADYFDCQKDPEITIGTYNVVQSTNTLTTTFAGENPTVYTVVKLNSKELEADTTINNVKIRFIFTSVP